MTTPELDLIADVMCDRDAAGRIIGRFPHLYLLRSSEKVIARFHADLDETAIVKLTDLIMRERGRPRDWECEYARYVEILCASRLTPITVRAGPLYIFPNHLPHEDGCVLVDHNNSAILLGGLDEWVPSVASMEPVIAVLQGKQIVSVCASVRASEAIHFAGVETLPSCRGRGLGSRAVSTWANAVRTRGAVPIYSTTFDNISSQALACRLNLIPKASEFSIRCE